MKPLKNLGVIATAIIAIIYILNPTAGIVEIIPDNLPIIGNLDEAAAVLLLLKCLAYFGIHFPKKRPK